MIRSMTGYGSAEAEGPSLDFRGAVAIRSLNHRYLDLSLHLSRSLVPYETDIKERVQGRLRRGKVEVFARGAFREEGEAAVVVSAPLVSGLVRALRALQEEHRLEGGVSVSDLIRFPGALEVVDGGGALSEGRRAVVVGLVEHALDALDAMRRAEGENLRRELERALGAIEDAAGRIEALWEEGKGARQEALLEKVKELAAELSLEEPRFYQEALRLVDRADVSEEVQRLRSHVALARELLRVEEPAGKRLDFLAQELMREANTAGSKAASAPIVREVVALKGEIEKLREQVQNVE